MDEITLHLSSSWFFSCLQFSLPFLSQLSALKLHSLSAFLMISTQWTRLESASIHHTVRKLCRAYMPHPWPYHVMRCAAPFCNLKHKLWLIVQGSNRHLKVKVGWLEWLHAYMHDKHSRNSTHFRYLITASPWSTHETCGSGESLNLQISRIKPHYVYGSHHLS